MTKFIYYLSLSVETFAYCILKNHFHLLIKALPEKEVISKTSAIPDSEYDSYYILPNKENKSFPIYLLISHWLNSYSKFTNNRYGKSGPVWDSRINKRLIDSDEYLQSHICYMHRNPIHHGISNSYTEYKYSSYSEILTRSSNIIYSDVVLDVFGSTENFEAAHQEFKGGYGGDEFEF